MHIYMYEDERKQIEIEEERRESSGKNRMEKQELPGTASVAPETEHLSEVRIEFLEWKLNGGLVVKVKDRVRPKS